jgi:diguanylate cyclase (GGDEF)-like protein/PAS domain S-box-containing protein
LSGAVISPDAHPRLREFAQAVRYSPTEVLTIDADRIVTSHNRSSSYTYGYKMPTIVGHTAEEVLPDDETRESRLEFIDRVLSGEQVPPFEQRRLTADGQPVYVEIYGAPIMDDTGAIVGMFASARDTTEERVGLAAREQTARQLSQSFQAVPIGVLMTDLEGRATRVNRAMCRLLGRVEEDLLGAPFGLLSDPAGPPVDSDPAQFGVADPAEFDIRTRRYEHPDGYEVWVELFVSLVTDADGAPTHYVIQGQDITQRHEREQRLQYMVDHDPLTGLLNRRGFDQSLRERLRRADPVAPKGALLLIDIDGFKRFDHARGHRAADQAVKEIAATLTSSRHEFSLVGRLGGDSFLVFLEGVARTHAELIALELSPQITAAAGRVFSDPQAPVTASIGIAFPGRNDRDAAGDLLEHAVSAMYAAKGWGGDRYAVYSAEE